MNRLLRRLAAHLFAADVYLAPRYLASDVNPADPPSRRWSLRAWQVRKRRAGRVFDSTLGYFGEGPPRCSFSARAAERPDVRLIEGSVRPSTTSTRAVASIGFDTFLAVTGRPSASDLASDPRAFDVAMVEYLQELWRTGAPQSIARTVAQWGPSAFPFDLPRDSLPGTRRALQAWARSEPGELRRPIPMIITKALLVTWISERRWGAAAVLLLMLGGVLRPGEATSLRRRHLSFPEDHGEPGLVIIAVEDPKTQPALQHATLEEPAAIPLLRWFIAALPEGSLLWPGPNYDARLASFAYALQRGLERLGLPANAYTPASMRAGAATAIWVRTFNGELVQRKGRWASARSLRHYLQQTAATLALTRLPLPVRQRCYALADLLPALLQPPLHPAPLLAPRRARRPST